MEFIEKGSKNDILYWSKRLYQKGMSPAKSGNISIKTKNGILISATGTCLNDMNENDIVLTDYSGNLIEGNKKPSSETIMHCEIYSQRDDITSIIHCHCPLISAFSVAGVPITKNILPDFAYYYGEVPIVPYYLPSSIELAQNTAKFFEKYDVVLLKNHGVVAGADSLQNAFYLLEGLRAYCETYFGAEVLGGAKTISKSEVLKIRQL